MNQQVIVAIECFTENNNFETVVAKSVDQTLSLLGEPVKKALYGALETSYGIKQQEIGLKAVAFTFALESLFGAASRILEIKIIKTLNTNVRGFTYRPKNGDFAFADYLTALQKHLNSTLNQR
jgi:hypothetical protein